MGGRGREEHIRVRQDGLLPILWAGHLLEFLMVMVLFFPFLLAPFFSKILKLPTVKFTLRATRQRLAALWSSLPLQMMGCAAMQRRKGYSVWGEKQEETGREQVHAPVDHRTQGMEQEPRIKDLLVCVEGGRCNK